MNIQLDLESTGEEERLYLSILIANTEVLKQVYPILDANLFSTPYSKRLCRWVQTYYDVNKKAPGDTINALFLQHKKEIHDPEEETHIRVILSHLNRDWETYEHHDTTYTTTQIVKFLNQQRLRETAEKVLMACEGGRLDEAEHALGQYRPVALNDGHNFNLHTDTDKIIQALSPDASKLFQIRGVLGEALGWFNKGEISACMGPTKSGKSFLLLHIAMEALLQGFKVLFINGELSEKMMIGRIWKYMVGQPIYLPHGHTTYRYTAMHPTACPTSFTVIDTEIVPPMLLSEVLPKFPDGTDEYLEHLDEFTRPQVSAMQQGMLKNTQNFRMHTTPRNDLKLSDIDMCLDNFRNFENFSPDLVVVDYADLIQHNSRMEALEREDYIWKTLGGIAQERDIALLTATQGNRHAADGKKYSASAGVGGAYKKLSHIGKFFCIAYEEEEAKANLRRVFHSLERDGECTGEEVVCTNCFEISHFATTSQYKKYVNHKAYQA